MQVSAGVAGANGGGPGQTPMQVPAPSAVQGAQGGGALVQGAGPTGAPAPLTTQAPTQAPLTQAPPTSGGGPADLAAVAPVLQQLVEIISQLTQVLGQSGAVAGALALLQIPAGSQVLKRFMR